MDEAEVVLPFGWVTNKMMTGAPKSFPPAIGYCELYMYSTRAFQIRQKTANGAFPIFFLRTRNARLCSYLA